MNTHDSLPSPACGRFDLILPLLDDPDTDAAAAVAAREHVESCPRCQARLARYAAIDRGLRLRYGIASVPPRPTEEIMRHISDHTKADETGEHTAAAHLSSPTPSSRPSSQSSLGAFLRGLGAVACIAALIAVSFALFNSRVHVGSSGKTYIGPPNYTFAGTTGSIASISMVSPNEGWALAQTLKTPQGARSAKEVTLYHYLRGKWFPVYVPISVDFSTTGQNGNGGPGGFNGTISMDSPTDGWADVHNFNNVTVLLHYTGGTWREVQRPGADVYGVRALSPHSVWAMGWVLNNQIPCPGPVAPGTTCTTPGANLLHFDGERWTSQSLPVNSSFGQGVIGYSIASDHQGWALVNSGGEPSSSSGQQFEIMRYDGSSWSVLSTFRPGMLAYMTAFSMVSDTEGWALGQRTVTDASGSTTDVPLKQVLYHYRNGHWSEVTLPISGGTFTTLDSISMLSPSDGWIVGTVHSAYPGATVADYQAHTIFFHYTKGKWTQVQTPDVNAPVDVIASMAFTADGHGWAVGYNAAVPASQTVQTDDIPDSASPMLWSYQNGAWSVYQQ